MHPACPNKKQNHLQNSFLRRAQFWVRKTFSKPASLKRASLVPPPRCVSYTHLQPCKPAYDPQTSTYDPSRTPARCKSPCRERSPLCSQNSHRATTGDHVTIQNGHRATTPAHFVHKIHTAPQRETTLRFKMATAPQRQPTLFTKFAPRHNGRPRYDPKLSLRHTRTLNHNVLLAQSETMYFNFFKRAKHVTIASFLTAACTF